MALSGSFYNYPTGQFGLYCTWNGVQSIIGNYTDVTLNVYLRYYTISVGARSDSTASINGTSETYTAPAINDMSSTSWHNVLLKTKTVRVYHNTNGTKTGVALSASWRFSGTYSGVSIGTITASTTVDLNSIDRSAPTVSCSTGVVSSSSFTISGVASTTCDIWWYSIDGGSTWTQYSTASGTSASITLTGKASNTYSVKVKARKKSNQVTGTSSASSVDIIVPTVTFAKSNITASSVYINASSSVTCDTWQYSINNGSTWVSYSTAQGTSAATTIAGLTPNGTYNIKVRARKKSNGLYGTSSASSVTTLGGSLLNTVSALTVDDATPVLSLNWTVYNSSYTHTLVIKNGSTAIVTLTGLSGSTGTNNKAVQLTTTQRTTILNAMASIASFTATFVLTTFSGSTQIGNASSTTATITTTSSNSAPTFTAFTFKDNYATTTAITGNDQLLIKGYSRLYITCTAAVAKNGASITKYVATIGATGVTSTATAFSYGTTSSTGSVVLTVTAYDSRGYTKSVNKTITIIDYTGITLDEWHIRRVNEVEATTQLSFNGTMSPITIDSVVKNALTYVRYRYKATTATTWSSWTTISGVDAMTTGFDYENLAFTSFNATKAYNIQLAATDKLTTYTVNLLLNQGTPLVAFRSKKVGINNVDPQYALDVDGEINATGTVFMNGQPVLGNMGTVTNFNTTVTSGLYYNTDGTGTGVPCYAPGILEVFSNETFVLQKYTALTLEIYVRYKFSSVSSFGSWTKI